MAQTPEEKKAYQAEYYQKNRKRITARHKEQNKKYYQENKEKISARIKKYRGENKERVSARAKKYREENKERIAARRKEYCQENKERVSARAKKYREENKEQVLAGQRKNYWGNREGRLVESRKYYQENKEEVVTRTNKYKKKNKEKLSTQRKKRNQAPCTSLYYLDHLVITDGAEWNGVCVDVLCKTCGKRFIPTQGQIAGRGAAIRGAVGSAENNLYCSDKCKTLCPVFRHRSDHPDPRLAPPASGKDKARACQTNALKQIQCDTHGYNYCEKCGDIIDVELHHTLPVAKYGKDAINGASHILLCPGCHAELHSRCAAPPQLPHPPPPPPPPRPPQPPIDLDNLL